MITKLKINIDDVANICTNLGLVGESWSHDETVHDLLVRGSNDFEDFISEYTAKLLQYVADKHDINIAHIRQMINESDEVIAPKPDLSATRKLK